VKRYHDLPVARPVPTGAFGQTPQIKIQVVFFCSKSNLPPTRTIMAASEGALKANILIPHTYTRHIQHTYYDTYSTHVWRTNAATGHYMFLQLSCTNACNWTSDSRNTTTNETLWSTWVGEKRKYERGRGEKEIEREKCV